MVKPAQPPAVTHVDPTQLDVPAVARLPDGRVDLKSLTLDQLTAVMAGIQNPERHALEVYKHGWKRHARGGADVTTISKTAQAELDTRGVYTFLTPVTQQDSGDGSTKYLWRCADGSHIESVLIPDTGRSGNGIDRRTLCVSTQVGCAMKCSFCLTGDLGLKRHLTPAEIANQPLQVQASMPPGQRITNIVMMGMGEPLHNLDNVLVALDNMLHSCGLNLSHRRVTVSTVGLLPAMRRLAAASPVNIAVSLNSTTEAQRRQVMPVTHRYSLAELMETCRTLPLPPGKRIAFEYVMMAGFNDDMDDAQRLVELMTDVPAKVNLIPYNENPDRDIRRPPAGRAEAFRDHLMSHGVHCSIRTTRGRDISAACGQLGKAADAPPRA